MLLINKNFKSVNPVIKVKRQIHPVGHGAFITEQFFDPEDKCIFTVVYDCGSRSKQLINKAITDFFNEGIKVDVLFISHFDSDHVNGLPNLSMHFSKDVKVFIPFFYQKLRNIYPKDKAIAIDLVFKTLKAHTINPIYVTYNANSYTSDELDINHPFNRSIKSGTHIHYYINEQIIWEYVPFNLFDEKAIYNKLKSLNIDFSATEAWSNEMIKDIRIIYHEMCSSINENSLIILSHTVKVRDINLQINDESCDWQCQNCSGCEYDRYKLNMTSAALYTGDSVLKANSGTKSKALKEFDIFLLVLCKEYAPVISLFQVPHHGSKNNSNSITLADKMILRLFVNCQEYNKIKHPNISQSLNKPIYIIDKSHGYNEEITFY